MAPSPVENQNQPDYSVFLSDDNVKDLNTEQAYNEYCTKVHPLQEGESYAKTNCMVIKTYKNNGEGELGTASLDNQATEWVLGSLAVIILILLIVFIYKRIQQRKNNEQQGAY